MGRLLRTVVAGIGVVAAIGAVAPAASLADASPPSTVTVRGTIAELRHRRPCSADRRRSPAVNAER